MRAAPQYYLSAHVNSELANNPAFLLAYKACFKHALLFHRKVLIADYMIVNSPNFRISYHDDKTFRELICDDFVEIAHFDKYKDGPHFTLPELREFYLQGEDKTRRLFHRNLPTRFRTSEFDSELTHIQNHLVQQFPPSEKRDLLFTQFVEDGVARDFLKKKLGSFFTSYEVAYHLMRDDVMKSAYPVFGIIHFDPEHSYKGDPNIFDYMARVPRIHDAKIELRDLKRRLAAKIARPHRALLVRSEMNLLKTHAILPSDFGDYRPFVLPDADVRRIDETEREEQRIQIDLSALSVQSIAALSASEIREYRRIGERFFEVMDRLTSSGNVSIAEISSTLGAYATALQIRMAEKQIVSRPSEISVNGLLRIVRGQLAKRNAAEMTVAVVVQLVMTSISSTMSTIISGPILSAIAKVAEGRFKEWANKGDETHILGDGVDAAIIKYKNGLDHLTQYE